MLPATDGNRWRVSQANISLNLGNPSEEEEEGSEEQEGSGTL